MNTTRSARIGVLVVFVSAQAWAMEAEVTGDRVNLRAAPFMEAEVPGQVNQGDRLRVKQWGEVWIEVAPPADLGFWVHRDFVEDGVVKASSLNIRTGPGIAHQNVGLLERGDRVRGMGSFGDWLKIAAPEGVSLWIHRDYARKIPPPPPPSVLEPPERPAPPPAEEPEPDPEPGVMPVSPVVMPRAPEDLHLVEEADQGRVMEREGVLRGVGFFFRRPSRFRLADPSGGRRNTICYVRGDEEQLKALTGLAVRIRGREYVTKRYRYPVLLADRIFVLR